MEEIAIEITQKEKEKEEFLTSVESISNLWENMELSCIFAVGIIKSIAEMKEKKLLVNILLKISHQIVKIVEQMIHY